ncbi:MAG: hypothetical protein MHM6MM_007418 [Cercozoa sp. M6MM]
MEANAQLIPPKYFVSLAKLEAKTTTHLQYILLAQCVAYIIGMLLQLWFFRWYNMTAAFIGVVSLYPGFYGQAKKSLNSLLVFLFFQGVGGAVVLVAACYSFLTLAWRDENDDCVDRGECVSALVHKVAGGGAVCMLIFFTFGGIYAFRLRALIRARDQRSSFVPDTDEESNFPEVDDIRRRSSTADASGIQNVDPVY